MKRVGIFAIFIFYILFCESCFFEKATKNKKIIYHLFDSLENYMCNIVHEKKNIGFFIYPNFASEIQSKIPLIEDPTYLISTYKYNQKYGNKRYDQILLSSNRYLEICGMLYPIFIKGVDDNFTDNIDSESLILYSHGHRLVSDIDKPCVIIDLNKSIFYDYYDITIPHGHLENLPKSKIYK